MPRLLLVDDNPSIHKIAETLLGPTSVELVCAASGEEAWALLEGGEAFDVALIDTAMPGLDGWGLLTRIREHVPTALLPVAMMAGVLDQVDQAQVDAAPIQGFLKKPIELRELGDRIHQIIATPVDAPASAFKTVPGTSLENLIHPLPETRVDEASMDRDDDLLILEEQDLYPGEPSGLVVAPEPEPVLQEPAAEVVVSDSLELEELDLETLKGLDAPELPAPAAHLEDLTPPVPLEDLGPTWADLPPLETEALPEPTPASAPMAVQVDDLPDLGEELDLVTMPPVWQEPPAALPAPEPILEPTPEPLVEALPEPEPAPIPVPVPAPVPVQAEAPAPIPAAPATALPEAGALAQAILADEALMEALARAVVAKLGDRALREIAWELMPDLAEKLRK